MDYLLQKHITVEHLISLFFGLTIKHTKYPIHIKSTEKDIKEGKFEVIGGEASFKDRRILALKKLIYK